VIKVVDGDTFDVEGIGRIRLADINTPEIDTEEGREAKEYVKGLCYQRKVYLDIMLQASMEGLLPWFMFLTMKRIT
jgi:micrococcal nuclease